MGVDPASGTGQRGLAHLVPSLGKPCSAQSLPDQSPQMHLKARPTSSERDGFGHD